MEMQRVSVSQSVQTQDKGHVVLQQTGVWRQQKKKRIGKKKNELMNSQQTQTRCKKKKKLD